MAPLRKFGSGDGEVTGTEGQVSKTAKADWTVDDAQALRQENAEDVQDTEDEEG